MKLQSLEKKLRVTQNVTQMSEEQYQALWNKTLDSIEHSRTNLSRKRREYRNFETKMIQYRRVQPWSATAKAVNFDKERF